MRVVAAEGDVPAYHGGSCVRVTGRVGAGGEVVRLFAADCRVAGSPSTLNASVVWAAISGRARVTPVVRCAPEVRAAVIEGPKEVATVTGCTWYESCLRLSADFEFDVVEVGARFEPVADAEVNVAIGLVRIWCAEADLEPPPPPRRVLATWCGHRARDALLEWEDDSRVVRWSVWHKGAWVGATRTPCYVAHCAGSLDSMTVVGTGTACVVSPLHSSRLPFTLHPSSTPRDAQAQTLPMEALG